MFELVLSQIDRQTGVEKKISKEFSSGAAMANWFYSQNHPEKKPKKEHPDKNK